jgi:hypothetical protein
MNTLRSLDSYLLRHGLDYSEEDVHRSRILGEWSNMIGYEMDSSPPQFYTTLNMLISVGNTNSRRKR